MMLEIARRLTLALSLLLAVQPGAAFADPCGMVPPIWLGSGPSQRITTP